MEIATLNDTTENTTQIPDFILNAAQTSAQEYFPDDAQKQKECIPQLTQIHVQGKLKKLSQKIKGKIFQLQIEFGRSETDPFVDSLLSLKNNQDIEIESAYPDVKQAVKEILTLKKEEEFLLKLLVENSEIMH